MTQAFATDVHTWATYEGQEFKPPPPDITAGEFAFVGRCDTFTGCTMRATAKNVGGPGSATINFAVDFYFQGQTHNAADCKVEVELDYGESREVSCRATSDLLTIYFLRVGGSVIGRVEVDGKPQ